MTAHAHIRVGDIWIPRELGWWIVEAVTGDAVTLRRYHGAETRVEPAADFGWPSEKWRHYTLRPRPVRVRSTSDFMSERERQDMRDAGRPVPW